MGGHVKQRQLEKRIKALLDEVDHILEDSWGDEFALHPNRPERGETWDPEMDGLFEIAADFTLGLGSQYGRGYLINLRVASLQTLAPERYEAFMLEAAKLIQERLAAHFPERHLDIVRDGPRFKLLGDFSLGPAYD